MIRAASCALVLVAAASAQTSRPAAFGRALAMDHLEARGMTAWIVGAQPEERTLVVARGGAEPVARVRGLAMRDVLLDPSGRTAFLLVGQGSLFSLEQVALDEDGPPRLVIANLAMPDPDLARSGDEVVLLTDREVLAVTWQGRARTLFRRDDTRITEVVRNAKGSVFATRRSGDVETVDAEGNVAEFFGEGSDPEFVDDDVLAVVSQLVDEATGHVPPRDVLSVHPGPTPVATSAEIVLEGRLSRVRSAGSGALLFHHAPWSGAGHSWLLHWRTGIVRPIEPSDRGTLWRAGRDTASRPAIAVDETPAGAIRAHARAEPESSTSGFFHVDGQGTERRTAYELSGWDDARHPEEARVHRLLLERFLEGLQWPLQREAGYEPYFATDDEPLRPSSSVPHLGLDVGARLLHRDTWSIAFHAAGAPVYPMWRGGTVSIDTIRTLRDEQPALRIEPFRILQEIELREDRHLLRVHIAYEHVRPAKAGEQPPERVTGSEPIGALEAFSEGTPGGGWQTSDPVLAAHGLAKGNHVHVGIGGIYRSFNTTPQAGARKLAWYRERLVPALRRAPGPN
jgi:hypothetical protein